MKLFPFIKYVAFWMVHRMIIIPISYYVVMEKGAYDYIFVKIL